MINNVFREYKYLSPFSCQGKFFLPLHELLVSAYQPDLKHFSRITWAVWFYLEDHQCYTEYESIITGNNKREHVMREKKDSDKISINKNYK